MPGVRSSLVHAMSPARCLGVVARILPVGVVLLFLSACAAPFTSASPSPSVPPSAASVALQPVQWLARLELPARDDCYAVKLDYMRLLTSLECARIGVVDYVRLELDPSSVSSTVGVRSLVLPLDAAAMSTSASTPPPAGLALVVFRKPGNMRLAVPLYLSAVLPGQVLSHVVVPPPVASGEATGSGVSVPVKVVAGFPAPPGSVAIAPLRGSDGYASVQCNVGSGTPVMFGAPDGGSLVGVVSRPGSCDGTVPSLVSLVSYWAPWLVDAAACSQNQQSFSTEGLAAAYSCEFSAL